MKRLGTVTGIIGVWLIITAFLKFSPAGVLWNNLLVGVFTIVLSLMIITEKSAKNTWLGWISLIPSLFIFVSTFIEFLRVGQTYFWMNLICGILIAVVGFSAMAQKAKQPKEDK
ncbi:MAG: hypothetical protein PHS99_04090 [Candidatus Marinimicrobia bacterium]|nr:hypothetical protein [Candidatus Neomarinimicrobiota bacterium]